MRTFIRILLKMCQQILRWGKSFRSTLIHALIIMPFHYSLTIPAEWIISFWPWWSHHYCQNKRRELLENHDINLYHNTLGKTSLFPKSGGSTSSNTSWTPANLDIQGFGRTATIYTNIYTWLVVKSKMITRNVYRTLTLVFWYFRPQTWQKRHRRQHQFSHCSSWGRSVSPKQKRWKGSQHTWQKMNYKQQAVSTFPLMFCIFLRHNLKQAKAYLCVTAAGTKKAHHPWGDWHGGKNAEPTHLPDILNVMILLEIYSDSMHSIVGRFLLGDAPSRGSALGV